jgi:TolB-like protein/Tfp pilus assembly protein PilF
MKSCPTCQLNYEDEAVRVCPDDGTVLVNRQTALADLPTVVVPTLGKRNSGGNDLFRRATPSGGAIAESQRTNSQATPKSIAILPFVNVGDVQSLEYLSDGITESLINNLSHLPQLRVIARSTVFRYTGKAVDPQEVGRELNVGAVLTGRVTHVNDRLHISVELADATDGGLIWGERYDVELTDLFMIQDEISREISNKLRIKLTSDEEQRMAKRHTVNFTAYQLYLKGRYCWNKRTPDGFKKGIEHFKQAIDLDSGYALAYAGLADSYNTLGNYSAMPPREAFPMAKTAAIKALRIDENLAEGHASLAYAKNNFDWDWEGAEAEFKRAIELKPSYATAHYLYAVTNLTATGRLDEALEVMKRASELDPLSLIISTNLGWIYYFARDYDKAVEQLRKTLEVEPDFNVAHYKLGQVYERKGMFEEAIAEYQKAKSLSGGNLWIIPALAHAHAQAGQFADAYSLLAVLKGLAQQRYISPYFFVEVYRGLGQVDKTFEWLDKAVEERSDWLIWLGIEPGFDSLRADPRFDDVMRRIGLSA